MNEFNPDQYRSALREKLGVKKKLPMQRAVGFVNTQTSSIAQDPSEFGSDGGGEAADPSAAPVGTGTGIPQDALLAAAGGQEGGEEVNQDEIAPAMALLNTLIQSVKEQSQTADDQVSGVMWNSLHNYIWKNRNKIAKKMMDDAQ